VTATAAPPRPRTTARTGVLVVTAVVGAVLAVVVVMTLLRPPAMVDRVVVENRSTAPITVRVSSGDESTVLPLGTVGGASSLRFEQVLDQGDRWTFRLHVGPDDVGLIRRSRAELEHDGWRVVVPRGVAAGVESVRG
jgi:hypothetical protein